MRKYIQTIPLSKIKRIAILTGDGRTLFQVKGHADQGWGSGVSDRRTPTTT